MGNLAALVVLAVWCGAHALALAHTTHGGRKSAFPAVHHIRVLTQRQQQYTLSVNITRLTESGQVAAVAISSPAGTATPTQQERAGHLLALYTHPSDPRAVVPVTFVNVTRASPGYAATGAATVHIKLLNFHSGDGLVLRLVSNSVLSPPAVLAESPVIANAIRDAPGQVHLAQHADGRSLVVQWVSGSAAPQTLEYRVAVGAACGDGSASRGRGRRRQRVASTSRTYTAAMMCGPPANSWGFTDPGHMHAAVIPGRDVRPDTRLEFRVGSDAAGWSRVFSATPSPDAADVAAGRASFTWLVFNDVGQENAVLFDNECPPYCPAGWQWEAYTSNSTKLVRHLAQQHAHLGLLIGDLAYANGFEADWTYFGHQFEPAFSRWPLAVASGNHERNPKDSGGECNVPYTYRYYTPAWHAPALLSSSSSRSRSSSAISGGAAQVPAHPSPSTSFYSFDMGGVHFLMLDSDAPSDPASPQGAFAAADLAGVRRAATPWLVVGLHRQMVGPTTVPDSIANMARLQGDFEALFKRHGVDLVLQGHDHAYARMCPVYKGRCRHGTRRSASTTAEHGRQRGAHGSSSDTALQTEYNPGAPIYMLAGHAGAGFTHAFPDPLPHWVAHGVEDRNGFLRVTVRGNRLTVVSVSTDDGSVMDGVQIVRDCAQPGDRRWHARSTADCGTAVH